MGAQDLQRELGGGSDIQSGEVNSDKINQLFTDLDDLSSRVGNDLDLQKLIRDNDGKIDLNSDETEENLDTDGDNDFDTEDFDSTEERDKLKAIFLKAKTVEGLYKWIKEGNQKVDSKEHQELTGNITSGKLSLQDNKVFEEVASQHRSEEGIQDIFQAGRDISNKDIAEYNAISELNLSSNNSILESKEDDKKTLDGHLTLSQNNLGTKNTLSIDLEESYLGGGKVQQTYKNALQYGDKIKTSCDKIGESEIKMGAFFDSINDISESNGREISDIRASKDIYDISIHDNNTQLNNTKALVPKVEEALAHVNSSIDILNTQIGEGHELAERLSSDLLKDSSNIELKDLLKKVVEKNTTLALKKKFTKTAQVNYKAELSTLNTQIGVLITKVKHEKEFASKLKDRVKVLQDAFTLKIKEIQKSIEAEKRVINLLLSGQKELIEGIKESTKTIDEYNQKLEEKETAARKKLQTIKSEAKEQFNTSDKSQKLHAKYRILLVRIERALEDDNLGTDKRMFGLRDSEFKDILDAKEDFDDAITESDSRLDTNKKRVLKKFENKMNGLTQDDELGDLLFSNPQFNFLEDQSLQELETNFETLSKIERSYSQITRMKEILQKKIEGMDIESQVTYQSNLNLANSVIILFQESLESRNYTNTVGKKITSVVNKLTPMGSGLSGRKGKVISKISTFMGGVDDLSSWPKIKEAQAIINSEHDKIKQKVGGNEEILQSLEEHFKQKSSLEIGYEYKKDGNIENAEIDEIQDKVEAIKKINSLIDKYYTSDFDEYQSKPNSYLKDKLEKFGNALKIAMEETSAEDIDAVFKEKYIDQIEDFVGFGISKEDSIEYFDLISGVQSQSDIETLIDAAKKYESKDSQIITSKILAENSGTTLSDESRTKFDQEFGAMGMGDISSKQLTGTYKMFALRMSEESTLGIGGLSQQEKNEYIQLMHYGKEKGILNTEAFHTIIREKANNAGTALADIAKKAGLLEGATIDETTQRIDTQKDELMKILSGGIQGINNVFGLSNNNGRGTIFNSSEVEEIYQSNATQVGLFSTLAFNKTQSVTSNQSGRNAVINKSTLYVDLEHLIKTDPGARELLLNSVQQCTDQGSNGMKLVEIAREDNINDILKKKLDTKISPKIYGLLLEDNSKNREELKKKILDFGTLLKKTPCVAEQQDEFNNLFEGLLDSDKLANSPRQIAEIFGISIEIEVKSIEIQISDLESDFDNITDITSENKVQVLKILQSLPENTKLEDIDTSTQDKLKKLGLTEINANNDLQNIILKIIEHKKDIAGLQIMKTNISVFDQSIWDAFLSDRVLTRAEMKTYLDGLPSKTRDAVDAQKSAINEWMNSQIKLLNKTAEIINEESSINLSAIKVTQTDSGKEELTTLKSKGDEQVSKARKVAGEKPVETHHSTPPKTLEEALKIAQENVVSTKVADSMNKVKQADKKGKKAIEEAEIDLNQAIAEDLPDLWEPLDPIDYPNTDPELIDRANNDAVSALNEAGAAVYNPDVQIPNGRLVSEAGVNYIYYGETNGNQSLIPELPNESGKYNSVLIGEDGKRIIVEISKEEKSLIQSIEGADKNIYNFYSFFNTVGFQDIGEYSEYVAQASKSLHIPRNGNMNSSELLNFSNYILQIIYGKGSGESNNSNISSAMLQLRNFSDYGILAQNQAYSIDAKDKFGYIVKTLIAPNGYNDSSAKAFENTANGKGLTGMWKDKFGTTNLEKK